MDTNTRFPQIDLVLHPMVLRMKQEEPAGKAYRFEASNTTYRFRRGSIDMINYILNTVSASRVRKNLPSLKWRRRRSGGVERSPEVKMVLSSAVGI